MPVVNTKGAASSQGFGEFAKTGAANYIEDVFSTYLYTGNGTSQTITNNIDLSTKGGLVWIKERSATSSFPEHWLYDTQRGATYYLQSNSTIASNTSANTLTSFNTTGFSIGSNSRNNTSAATYVSWTFRKQAKFFDIVTYTGNGVDGRVIPHNLGSNVGMITVKDCTSSTYGWMTWHKNLTSGNYIVLNETAAETTAGAAYIFGNAVTPVNPTSTGFTVASNILNITGNTYVAYLFASNAGGFGNSGTDNVITCGSFTTDSGGLLTAPISLGYEPQWVMYKRTDGTSNWSIVDTMRGFINSSNSDSALKANDSAAEAFSGLGAPSATGIVNDAATNGFFGSSTYIYIAIRRGPMKTPTDATTVFNVTNSNTGGFITTNFPVDSLWQGWKSGYVSNASTSDRLRGVSTTTGTVQYGPTLSTSQTTAENAYTSTQNWNNIGFTNADAGNNTCQWAFGRAPGFFDEVCYTGTGSATTQTHNLGVVPELMIIKSRSTLSNWPVYVAPLGNSKNLLLNTTSAEASTTSLWNSTTPTTSVFSLGTGNASNQSGSTFVAYLFATLAGVSKVGTYTGNGTTQTINCGFTGGARFVLIKRTDSTGDWYTYDTARGMTTLTDPYLLLNSDAAQVATLGSVTTVTTGFAVNAAILAAINTSAATYIFLAIA